MLALMVPSSRQTLCKPSSALPSAPQVAAAFNALTLPNDVNQRNTTLQSFISQVARSRCSARWAAAALPLTGRIFMPALSQVPLRMHPPAQRVARVGLLVAHPQPQPLFFLPQWLLPPGTEMTNATGVLEQAPPGWFDSLPDPAIRDWAYNLFDVRVLLRSS